MSDPFPYGTETTAADGSYLWPKPLVAGPFAPRPLPHPMDDATGRAAALVGTVLVIAAGLLVGGGLTAVTIWWRNR